MKIEKINLTEEDIINGSGFVHQKSVRETFPLHTHSFYEIFYIIRGKAIHNINGENQVISAGDFVFIRPSDIHKYEFMDNFDFEIVSLGFSVSSFHEAVSYLKLDPSVLTEPKLPPIISLTGYALSDIRHMLLHINSLQMGEQRKKYFTSLLPFLLNNFFANVKEPARTPIPIWLADVITQMNAPEYFIAGLPKLIEISHTSQEHLTREFRKHLEITPTEFINMKRLNYAAALLSENKYNITDICFMCGFSNLSHFYHTFKKQYGCTPRQFMIKYNV